MPRIDAQLCARLPTYQHALASGKPFDSILAELRKLHDTLGPSSRKAPIVTSTGDSDGSALGKLDRVPAGLPDSSLREAIHSASFQDAVRKIKSIDLSTPNGPLMVIKEVFVSDSMILQRYIVFRRRAALALVHGPHPLERPYVHHRARECGQILVALSPFASGWRAR